MVAARIPSDAKVTGLSKKRYATVGENLYTANHGKEEPPKNHKGSKMRIHTLRMVSISLVMLEINSDKKPPKMLMMMNISKNLCTEKLVKCISCHRISLPSGKIIMPKAIDFIA